eukprot:10238885-Alexandrium_andersonii.AAC.1
MRLIQFAIRLDRCPADTSSSAARSMRPGLSRTWRQHSGSATWTTALGQQRIQQFSASFEPLRA